jgi:cytochrome c-type biogenesis protein CcmH/NrfG
VVEMNLKDAVNFLARATKADAERFGDAFALLAECAWNTQDFDLGRPAAEQAVARQPKNAEAQLMLGRIALAQYSAAAADASQKAAADKHWEAGRAALQKAIELLSGANDAEHKTTLAKAHVDLGHAYKWKDKPDDAAREYGLALGADPSIVNYQQILGALGNERFLAALEAGEKAFQESSGPTANGDAALLWWLGWSRFDQKQYDKADQALSEAVKKNASFVNSWYWIALARYYQKNYEGAVAALRRYHDENPADLVASIKTNTELNLRIVDFLVGWCAQNQRNLEAAILSETQAEVAPTNADYWNNAGLFYREAGAGLRKSEKPEDRTQAMSWFEKSYAAYTKALEISPDNPSLLNDTAVMLHYYLDRDLDKAKAMYMKAAERAEAELKRTDLEADVRDRLQTALRDSKNNLAKLEKGDKKEN